jgi:DNA-binding response OmpR family regulator
MAMGVASLKNPAASQVDGSRQVEAGPAGTGALPLRLLVVASDSRRAAGLRNDLLRLGGRVTFSKPEDLGKLAGQHQPRAVILDLLNCEEAPDDLRRAIEAARGLSGVPLLAIVGDVDPAADGSFAALDDFIISPYRRGELALRLRRLIERSNGSFPADAIVRGSLTLDPGLYEVRLDGARVDLTLKEYELLRYLLTNPGRVFTRGQLLSTIWGYEYLGGTRTVDVHIRRLRAKLGDVGERWIETVRGVGYAFRPDEPESP